MIKPRNIHLVLALAAVAALPGCSDMFGNRSGGGSQGSSAAAAAPQPVANEMVRQVQERLKNDGYYKTGAVDGVWGSGTMTAVQNFQRDHNLTASGQLDVPTLRALNVANTGNANTTGTSSSNTNMNGTTTSTGNYNANNPNMNTTNPNAPANPANTYPDNRSYNGQSTTGTGTGTSTGTGSNAPR
ncbi:MAG: hypothetical protein BGO51_07220 [Rhodospirillales bacterium 69-11]|nr:peptidoglycan-binding protein [Rhodospirillales bacterium]OJW24101.1 MAG: hypothetical protein BGO51_07220 [Rhodospirillales bacterium 69-11]